MQPKLPWLCALLLGAIGWLVGYSMNGDSGPGAREGREKRVAAADRENAGGVPPTRGAVGAGDDLERAMGAALADEDPLRQAHRLYLMVADLPATKMAGALNAAIHLDPEKRGVLIHGLLAHWAVIDPRAAAEYAESLPGNEFRWACSEVLVTWSQKDFAAASQYALALPAGKDRDAAAGAIALGLAKSDPLAGLRFIEANIGKASRDAAMNSRREVIGKWALQDFQAAAAYALTLKDLDERRGVLNEIANTASAKDPQEVLTWATGIPDPQSRNLISWNAFARWSNRDPLGVLQYARGLPSGQSQRSAFSAAVSALAIRDVREAQRVIEELPEGSTRDYATGALVSPWSEQDPKAAAEYVQQLPAGSLREELVGLVARNQARNDPAAAFDLAETLPITARAHTVQDLTRIWAKSDPRAAADYLLRRAGTLDSNDSPISVAVQEWGGSNAADAFEWVEKMPEGKLKNDALGTVIGNMAASSPEAALALAMKQSGEAQSGSAAAAVSTWMYQDPAAASAWVAKLPEGDTRKNAAMTTAATWARINPSAAANWIGTLPAGASRDAAVGAFVDQTMERNPAAAMSWAATITDDAMRQNTVEKAAQDWLRRDEKAARAWLASTPLLPEDARQRLLGTKPN